VPRGDCARTIKATSAGGEASQKKGRVKGKKKPSLPPHPRRDVESWEGNPRGSRWRQRNKKLKKREKGSLRGVILKCYNHELALKKSWKRSQGREREGRGEEGGGRTENSKRLFCLTQRRRAKGGRESKRKKIGRKLGKKQSSSQTLATGESFSQAPKHNTMEGHKKTGTVRRESWPHFQNQ